MFANLSDFARRDPLGFIGLVLVLLILFCGVFGPWLAPYSISKIDVPSRLMAPSWEHLMGTDKLGRDVFSRVLAGSALALQIGIVTVGLSVLIGTALGLIAGYGPRWLDSVLILIFDTTYSFPTVILGLALVTLFGPSTVTLMGLVMLFLIPAYARLVRTSTLAAKSSDYVLALRSLGASPLRIVAVHVLPNVIGPVIIVACMDVPAIIALEAGLTYLGLGVPPPAPSWGRILEEGTGSIREAPWIVFAGGLPIILATLGFTFLGESLRDRLDPKRKGRE
ncbi:MAG TPA: ABC transporter permease [Tabrizicola sp.]|nr:ABC transporter permease [Tabrizicola sp.]